jgi:general stress protein 26
MVETTIAHVLAVVKDIIHAAEFSFLLTRGKGGEANARLMQPFPPEQDLTIWMGASPRSRKVREIERYWRVSLAYARAEVGAYVTLLGTATVVTDLDQRRHYWREAFRPFWPQGPEDNDYALIRFEPERIEVMHLEREVAPEPFGLRPAVLVRQADTWVVEEEHAAW